MQNIDMDISMAGGDVVEITVECEWREYIAPTLTSPEEGGYAEWIDFKFAFPFEAELHHHDSVATFLRSDRGQEALTYEYIDKLEYA